MSTRMLFMVFFASGIAFVGFAQVYLYRKWYGIIRRSPLRRRTQQVLIALLGVLLTCLYLPYVSRLFYKWPGTRGLLACLVRPPVPL
jgi:hypothetical protein